MKRFEVLKSTLSVLFCNLLVLAFGCNFGLAQDESLDQLQQNWIELQIEFAAKEAAISLGQGDVKQLQTDYRDLVQQANQLIPRMKERAIAHVKENPTDLKTLRLIMGILLHEARIGQDRSVLEAGEILISLGIKTIYFEVAAKADSLPITGREIFEELLIRQREAELANLPRVKLETTKGNIVVELFEDHAPNTVKNFVSLVEANHFSDIQFHRVIDGFMAQAGQNKGDGSPAPELNYTIPCECYTPDTRRHFTHCISMALAGKDTGSGQFFLTFSRTSDLDGQHTCFGRIVEGTEVLEKIERTANGADEPIPNVVPDRIIRAEVLRKRDHDYRFRRLGDPDPAVESKLDQAPTLPTGSPESSAEPGLPELPKNTTEPNTNGDEKDLPPSNRTSTDGED